MNPKRPRFHELILDSLSDGVFTVDHDLVITSFNHAAERIFGISRGEAIGQKCHELFHTGICQEGCTVKETLRSGEPPRPVRIDIRNSDGELVPVRVSTVVLRGPEEELMGAIRILHDLRDLDAMPREPAADDRPENNSFGEMVGGSPAMKKLFKLIPDVAATEATVLIVGASGTGKELVARALHQLSPRRERPFVVLNCGALPDTLLESELFGYRKGAFTGAHLNRRGLLAQAEGGTLLLDEICDTSAAFQVKLLRVLQEGEYRPLGTSEVRTMDVRVLAACNRDLLDMVRSGTFREDLYYRLCVIPMHVPPLCERRMDIPLLLRHFMARLSAQSGKQIDEVAPAALATFYDYDYPGNVRELINILERAFVLCHGNRIEKRHLPEEMWRADRHLATGGTRGSLRPSDRAILDAEVEKDDPRRESPEALKLIAVLEANNWNRTRTAQALGIGRNTLWRRMKEYGLLSR